MISFFVPGRPKSTQTGKVIRTKAGRLIPLRMNTPWSAYCGLVAKEHAPEKPLEGPLSVTFTFYLQRPKKPKAGLPVSRPDAENLLKGIVDQLNGVLWVDDSQIVDLTASKRWTREMRPEGVFVEVEKIE